MITRDEIEAKGSEFGIHVANVERDYVFGWLLAAIYGDSPLRDVLILKGGNAFRKAYFETTRFSADLDFSTQQAIDPEFLNRELNRACEVAGELSGVRFDTESTRVEIKDLVQLRSELGRKIYEIRLYFEDFYGRRSDALISIRMDVTEFDRILLPIQGRQLIHSYSDSAKCRVELRCIKIEELLATKLKCLLQRRRANDLYDYIYSIFIRHEIDVDRAEIVRTFLDKTIFRPDPTAAKDLLLGLPFERFHEAWDNYIVCPKSVWIRFEEGLQRFRENMEELFHGMLFRERQLAFFPAQYRNPIMDAGSSMTLLRLTYSGVERLVEPYSLVYKRRQDGTAQEYFYAYDRTGGLDSGPDIKTFVASGVQSLAPTEEKFEPRYPVELSKAGEPAGKGYFGGSFSGGRQPRRIGTLIRRARARTGMVYVLQCPYCTKTFRRSKLSRTLRTHQDKYGNRCYGRVGTLIEQ